MSPLKMPRSPVLRNASLKVIFGTKTWGGGGAPPSFFLGGYGPPALLAPPPMAGTRKNAVN